MKDLVGKIISFLINVFLKSLKQDVLGKLFNYLKKELLKSLKNGDWIKLAIASVLIIGACLVLFLL